MKLALYLPRYLQAISLPLLGPKILSFFDFLCSVSPYCISILWHKIQSRSFSHPYTSKPPASRSRAVSGVRKCFFIGKWLFCVRVIAGLLGGLVKDCGGVAASRYHWGHHWRVCRFGLTILFLRCSLSDGILSSAYHPLGVFELNHLSLWYFHPIYTMGLSGLDL